MYHPDTGLARRAVGEMSLLAPTRLVFRRVHQLVSAVRRRRRRQRLALHDGHLATPAAPRPGLTVLARPGRNLARSEWPPGC
jgi:hypothetical protein